MFGRGKRKQEREQRAARREEARIEQAAAMMNARQRIAEIDASNQVLLDDAAEAAAALPFYWDGQPQQDSPRAGKEWVATHKLTLYPTDRLVAPVVVILHTMSYYFEDEFLDWDSTLRRKEQVLEDKYFINHGLVESEWERDKQREEWTVSVIHSVPDYYHRTVYSLQRTRQWKETEDRFIITEQDGEVITFNLMDYARWDVTPLAEERV